MPADQEFGIICTLIINESFVQALSLQYMKLAEPPRVRAQWLDYVLSQVEEHGEEMLKGAKKDRVLGHPDWRMVQRLADLRPRKTLRQQHSLFPSDHGASDRAARDDAAPSKSAAGEFVGKLSV